MILRLASSAEAYTASDVIGVWLPGEARDVSAEVASRLLAQHSAVFSSVQDPEPVPEPAPEPEPAPAPKRSRKGA